MASSGGKFGSNHLTTIINNLEEEVTNLEATTKDLEKRVEEATRNLREIANSVLTWLQKSKIIKQELEEILKEVLNVESGCLNVLPHFSLSKKAKKIIDRSKELRARCTFDANAISMPGLPFESRKQIEDDIVATLVAGDVNTIGICGMVGVGKTIMARRIMNITLAMKVFDKIVIAVVGQTVDKPRVQHEIFGQLGLGAVGERWRNRLQYLHTWLTLTNKRILLVLDDVWEILKLEDFGIPRNHKGCKIIITSRNSDVVRAMNVEKIFEMEMLSNEDAWILFRNTMGKCVDDNTELNSITKDVVNECKGLPIVLTTVGESLKDVTRMAIWKDRVSQLRNCDPSIPGILEKVYNPLKLSYDALDSNYQSLFLLCCLYPKGADVPIESLTYFCVGLGICEGITSLEDARNHIFLLTDVLKRRHLFLHSKLGDDYVRMHDVVHDVCIFIAKQKKCIGGNDCTWISSFHDSELRTMSPAFLNLRELTIIDYKGNGSFFPSTITGSLVNLASLTIRSCYEMVKVIEDDHEKDKIRLFPKLEKLELDNLHKLVSFCEWKCEIELPLLSEVKIMRCPNMKRCTLGCLVTPKLGIICINRKDFDTIQDLNGLLRQVYEEERDGKLLHEHN